MKPVTLLRLTRRTILAQRAPRLENHTAVMVFAMSLVFFACIFSGCGSASLSYTIDSSKLKDMSRNGQLWIYDAENEIIVALDRLDEAKDELHAVRRQIKKTERTIKRAEKRKKVTGVKVAEAWEKYLELLEDWAKENVKLQLLGVTVARATVELAKAQVIQREDLLGGKDFDITDYRKQFEGLQQDFEERKKRVSNLRRKARTTEQRWWRFRAQVVARTGDHDSGLWID